MVNRSKCAVARKDTTLLSLAKEETATRQELPPFFLLLQYSTCERNPVGFVSGRDLSDNRGGGQMTDIISDRLSLGRGNILETSSFLHTHTKKEKKRSSKHTKNSKFFE